MNILLVANIGSGSGGFYHVGDEAMFYETYRWYKKHVPSASLGALSSSYSHRHLKLVEHLNLPWPEKSGEARMYFLKILFKAIVWKIAKKSFFSSEQFDFLTILNSYDRIHFTGGGNLTSLFGSWLYYSYLIISLAWLFKKEIVLTSQTIGPFSGIDRLITVVVMNLPHTLFLRECLSSIQPLLNYGIVKPTIGGMKDAATTLSMTSAYRLPFKKKVFRIGLSLHPWSSYATVMEHTVNTLIEEFGKKYQLEIVLIPHVITKNLSGGDMAYMKNIVKKFPKTISIIYPTYNQLMQSSFEPASTVKYLTSAVDLLISSRYHGLVFALSTNIPCIGFIMDSYYTQKNKKLFEFYPQSISSSRFLINLDSKL